MRRFICAPKTFNRTVSPRIYSISLVDVVEANDPTPVSQSDCSSYLLPGVNRLARR
ncbi:hypothetical protein BDV26DRAFT_270129 [Aspergillus bertholletiae]|uniref:Uncharacterized protein n=1 Tax=Aspergillus bertholletiae TaxID=1226010 RepID=A0A5N7AWV6_9EURO|nr:hypothetical protein BDV26DRAFT_270129 [Aspergillus bertholletiae]